MIDYITDEREEGILDAGWDEMLDKEYGQSVIKVLKQTEKYLKQGRTSGQFRYDEVTGRRLTEFYEPENMLTGMKSHCGDCGPGGHGHLHCVRERKIQPQGQHLFLRPERGWRASNSPE